MTMKDRGSLDKKIDDCPHLIFRHEHRRVSNAFELDEAGPGSALGHRVCGFVRQQIGIIAAQHERR
jgi:hypothetical protein